MLFVLEYRGTGMPQKVRTRKQKSKQQIFFGRNEVEILLNVPCVDVIAVCRLSNKLGQEE